MLLVTNYKWLQWTAGHPDIGEPYLIAWQLHRSPGGRQPVFTLLQTDSSHSETEASLQRVAVLFLNRLSTDYNQSFCTDEPTHMCLCSRGLGGQLVVFWFNFHNVKARLPMPFCSQIAILQHLQFVEGFLNFCFKSMRSRLDSECKQSMWISI